MPHILNLGGEPETVYRFILNVGNLIKNQELYCVLYMAMVNTVAAIRIWQNS